MQDKPMRRVVLIGATGFFGRRLAERLATIPQIALVVTSRDEARARQAAEAILVSHASASVISLAFERDDPASLERLRALSPWLVIDASGPFQSADYRLARAVLDMGAHWIDLADARDYLVGFEAALDEPARHRGLVARAGASSTPALSDAVVASLTHGWRRIDTVDIAITPGGAGDVGEAVIGAILSYAGSPVAIFSEGQRAATSGWGSVRRSRIDGLGVRYLSPVETADADLLPSRFAITSRVAFYAGLESRVEQFGLLCLAKLRQIGVAGDLRRLAPLLRSARKLTSVTASDRGGMTVDCTGFDGDGRQICARWKLIAEQGAGPNVPILPALALVRALLKGEVASGAGPAVGILSLDAIEAEMLSPSLRTSRASSVNDQGSSLFAEACGADAYRALPRPLRAFHDNDGVPVWTGKADIDVSRNLLARCVRFAFGFPPAGRDVPITVSVDRRAGQETWTRNFAGQRFASRLTHESGNVVSERFGPFKILLEIKVVGEQIEMPVIGWRLGPVALPRALAPKSDTREFVDDRGRFRFDVAIGLPLIGQLAHYRGWLEPKILPARDFQDGEVAAVRL